MAIAAKFDLELKQLDVVNAFVNCGFGKDSLMTPEGSDWL